MTQTRKSLTLLTTCDIVCTSPYRYKHNIFEWKYLTFPKIVIDFYPTYMMYVCSMRLLPFINLFYIVLDLQCVLGCHVLVRNENTCDMESWTLDFIAFFYYLHSNSYFIGFSQLSALISVKAILKA